MVAGGFTFHVWPEGIGFSASLLGRGFVRREEVRSLGRSGRRRPIEHLSPEVRGGLLVPAEVAEALVRVLDAPPPPSLPARVVRPFRPSRPVRTLVALGAGLAAVVFGVFVWMFLHAGAVRSDVREFIDACGPEAVVVVDGQMLPRNRELLVLLRGLCRRIPVRVVRGRRLPVAILDGSRRIDLELARRRYEPLTCVVYRPGGSNPAGRIRTDILDPIAGD